MIRRYIFRDVWRGKTTCSKHKKCIKWPFLQHLISTFCGEACPWTPLASPPFGRGSGLWPLNFCTQVHSLCTQVQTGLGKTLRIDPGSAFLLPERSTQASAVHSRRTAEGFGTKNKNKNSRVRGRHFRLGKPFSDEPYPDLTPCVECVVHASVKTSAGQPSLAGCLGQFKNLISARESPPWHCSAGTLPKRPPILHQRLFFFFHIQNKWTFQLDQFTCEHCGHYLRAA